MIFSSLANEPMIVWMKLSMFSTLLVNVLGRKLTFINPKFSSMHPVTLNSKTISVPNSIWGLCKMMMSILTFPYLTIGKEPTSFNPFFITRGREWLYGQKKYLTKAGRVVLIQGVLQAIPVHIMPCLKFPKLICAKIESYLKKFFWGGSIDLRKIHWIDWNTLCTRKLEVGLGFRNLLFFNQAILAKQAWKIATQTNSLLHKLFKAIYFPRNSFLQASMGKNPSYYWRDLIWGQELLKTGLGWRIGIGNEISIRQDNWIPGKTYFQPYSTAVLNPANTRVSQLINEETRSWKIDLIRENFISLLTWIEFYLFLFLQFLTMTAWLGSLPWMAFIL